MKPTPKQIKRRDDLMAPFMKQKPDKNYQIAYFSGLDNITLQILIDEGFADPEERQNEAHSIGEYQEFINDQLSFRAHGYVVSPSRADYRISIEGLDGARLTIKELPDAVWFERHADELTFIETKGTFHSWWD